MNQTLNGKSRALNDPTKTYSFGLIGYPLGHSLSPQIHQAALRALGLSGEYRLFPISPSQDGQSALSELLSQVRNGNIQGLNVTIPHKQNVMRLLDHLTPTANSIGAVNTIFSEGDRLVGDNTDAQGFWVDLKRLANINNPGAKKRALILGAGGIARADAYALLTHGYSVTIAARRSEQARALSEQLSVISNRLSEISLNHCSLVTDHRLFSPGDWSLITNTTPVGMHPNIHNSPWPQGVPFPEDTAVYDLVYNPRETLLVKQAREAGIPAKTGLGMLIEQAALAFERWTGMEAPRPVMMEAAEAKS